jgi:hypothetical protein
MQPQIKDPLLAESTKDHIQVLPRPSRRSRPQPDPSSNGPIWVQGCLPQLATWSQAVLQRVKHMAAEDSMGRRYYWEEAQELTAQQQSPRGKKKK